MSKTNINLLPTQLAPKSSVVKFVKFVKKGIVFGFSLYVVCAIASIASFLFLSNQLKDHSSKEAELKKSIKALEETEQRLILIQDRLGKAETVLGNATTIEEVNSFDFFVKDLPENVSFGKAELFPDSYVVDVSTENSEDFATLFSNLSSKEEYKNVVLVSYFYSEEDGYRATLRLSI